MKLLEDSIVPVVRVGHHNGGKLIERFHGTAFFIDTKGTFVTASHVLANADADAGAHGGTIALVCRDPTRPELRFAKTIVARSFATQPNDVAVGKVNWTTKAAFELVPPDAKLWVWQEVWTAGYPESARVMIGDLHRFEPRGYYGYILRRLPRGKLLVVEHPDAFELSFPVVAGMSGAPLFLRNINSDLFVLVGVCRGSHPSEIVDYVSETVIEEGKTLQEKRIKVEEYGIADDIRPLADWHPVCMDGVKLGDAFRS
jgi:trypsin-like peptidase